MESITDLPGVGPAMAEKLESSGYRTLMSIAAATPRELAGLLGSTEPAMQKLITAARDDFDFGFETGDKVLIRLWVAVSKQAVSLNVLAVMEAEKLRLDINWQLTLSQLILKLK